MSEPAEDIGKVVSECGFVWPDDEAGQRRVLEHIARLVRFWRQQVNEWHIGVWKERAYVHLNNRCWALTRRMNAIRKAAMEFRQGQRFDVAAAYKIAKAAEADALKMKARAEAAEAELARLKGANQ